MQYFKNFKLFEADETTDPKPVEKTEEKKDAAPSYNEKFTFRNTFNYNKIQVNESFDKTMKEAISKLDEFMKTENKDNRVEVVQINAQGFASWVPTKYNSKIYDIKNNQKLAADRGKSIADEVKKRVQKYFVEKGIKDVQFKNSEIKGNVDYKNSKEVFAKFIKDNYDATSLIAELQKLGAKELTLVKDVAKVEKPEQYLNVNSYGTKYPDNVKKVKVDKEHADEIYNDLQKSPMYVLFTSHLTGKNGKIESAYRQSTQYAIIEILINDPSDLPPVPVKETKSVTIKSISFEKDVDATDAAGKEALNILTAYLQKTPADKINQFILIGHAEADDELNKVTFNPENGQLVKDKAGKETIMSETQLATLRFELSIARCKTVFRAIENIESTKALIKKQAFWMLPAGTLFGDALVKANSSQRIVQVVVITSDAKEINTEIKAVPYGTKFESATLDKINKNISTLGFTFSKLVPNLIGTNSFGTPVPNHLDLAKDVDALAAWKAKYV